jgi:hypothetical protein
VGSGKAELTAFFILSMWAVFVWRKTLRQPDVGDWRARMFRAGLALTSLALVLGLLLTATASSFEFVANLDEATVHSAIGWAIVCAFLGWGVSALLGLIGVAVGKGSPRYQAIGLSCLTLCFYLYVFTWDCFR